MAAREKVANAERKCRPVFHGREGVGDGAAFIQDVSAMAGQSPYSAANLGTVKSYAQIQQRHL